MPDTNSLLRYMPPILLSTLTYPLIELINASVSQYPTTIKHAIFCCYLSAIWIGYYVVYSCFKYIEFSISFLILSFIIFTILTFIYLFFCKSSLLAYTSLQFLSFIFFSICASCLVALDGKYLLFFPPGATEVRLCVNNICGEPEKSFKTYHNLVGIETDPATIGGTDFITYYTNGSEKYVTKEDLNTKSRHLFGGYVLE